MLGKPELIRHFECCLRYVKGDLFTSPASESLAHCISADAKMGKGIAVMFKKQFGGVDEIMSQEQKPGGCAVLERDSRYIYNLVTKERYFQKPTYKTLESSLKRMNRHCELNAVRNLSMPKIGAGLDKLEWRRVEEIIKKVFERTEISITVYDLPHNVTKGRGSGFNHKSTDIKKRPGPEKLTNENKKSKT